MSSIFSPALIADLVILAAIIIPVFTYASKGFLRSVIEFFSFWIALVATCITVPLIVNLIKPGGLLKVIVYVVVLLLWLLIVKLVAKIFSSVLSKLPIIGKIDKLLGAVLGLFMGIVFASLIVYVAGIVLKEGTELYTVIEGSKIAAFIRKINIFNLVFNFIK